LVGLIFDGNIQSLVGDFIYDESVNRAISLFASDVEVLRKVFEANDIAAELLMAELGKQRQRAKGKSKTKGKGQRTKGALCSLPLPPPWTLPSGLSSVLLCSCAHLPHHLIYVSSTFDY